MKLFVVKKNKQDQGVIPIRFIRAFHKMDTDNKVTIQVLLDTGTQYTIECESKEERDYVFNRLKSELENMI